MTSEELKVSLKSFIGTTTYYTHWLKKFYYTDGVKFLASVAQAYWLLDAIASHQSNPKLLSNPALREIQFWKLEVNSDKSARLVCLEDKDAEPSIEQTINHTDFPLSEITLYLQSGGKYWVLMQHHRILTNSFNSAIFGSLPAYFNPMNSQQLEGQILTKVKQINLQLSELQSHLATQEKIQTKLHIASLKGKRRGLLEALQLLNESWSTNTCQNLGKNPEEQLQQRMPTESMDCCQERLNTLNFKWKVK